MTTEDLAPFWVPFFFLPLAHYEACLIPLGDSVEPAFITALLMQLFQSMDGSSEFHEISSYHVKTHFC